MTDRSGGGEEVCSAIAGDRNRGVTGVVSRWTKSGRYFWALHSQLLHLHHCRRQRSSHRCMGKGKSSPGSSVPLQLSTVVGSQEMIAAKLIIKDNMSWL